MVDVVVLGAGITGLAVAQRQLEAGREVLVLDQSDAAGGLLGTLEIGGYRFDQAANTLSADAGILAWLARLGLEDRILRPKPAAKRRYLYTGGRLTPVPTGPWQLMRTPLLSAKAKGGLLRELLLKPHDPGGDTVAQFFRRHFGDEVTEAFVKPFVAGIFAGDADRMGLEAAFPRLAELERRYGSVIRGMMKKRSGSRRQTLSLDGGMSVLVEALAEALGGRLEFGAKVVSLRRNTDCVEQGLVYAGGSDGSPETWEVDYSDASGVRQTVPCREIRLCLPAHAAAGVMGAACPDVAAVLESVEYTPVIQIFVGYRHEQLGTKPDGFGFLVPPREGRSLLGALWNSAVFEGRAPEGCEAFTLFAGGALKAEEVLNDPDRLAERALAEFAGVMGVEGGPEVLRVQVFRRGIPHPGVDHGEKIAAIRRFESENAGIRFHGNYLDGISMRELILSARRSL